MSYKVLSEQIDKGYNLIENGLTTDSPEFSKWYNETLSILISIYGKLSREVEGKCSEIHIRINVIRALIDNIIDSKKDNMQLVKPDELLGIMRDIEILMHITV